MLSTNDCLDVQCPIQFVLNIIDGKWSILILRELLLGDCRTHQLCKALPGISTKTLTARLRDLEAHGLVERRVYAEVPPRVEYSLTPKGHQIKPVLLSLYGLGQQWLDQANCACPIQRDSLGTQAPSPH